MSSTFRELLNFIEWIVEKLDKKEYSDGMNSDKILREQLVNFLSTAQAHMTFSDAVADFSEKEINSKAPHVDYTFWHLVEHIRITQRDILEYMKDPNYKEELKWPDDYWPEKKTEATKEVWQKSIKSFQSDLDEVVGMVKDPAFDLFAHVPSTTAHTQLREVMMIIDHNSHHVGELAILRQVLQAWPEGR